MSPLVALLPLVVALAPPAPPATAPAPPAWVARSDAHAQLLLELLARFNPEDASALGVAGRDDAVMDLGPGLVERRRAALLEVRHTLEQRLAAEQDSDVRQDLRILVHAVQEDLEDTALQERYLLPWVDAPEAMFLGLSELLQEDVAPERRAHALPRLRRYVGLEPGTTPLTVLARARYEEALAQPERRAPLRTTVERSLTKAPTYVKGLRELFAQFPQEGAAPERQAGDRSDLASAFLHQDIGDGQDDRDAAGRARRLDVQGVEGAFGQKLQLRSFRGLPDQRPAPDGLARRRRFFAQIGGTATDRFGGLGLALVGLDQRVLSINGIVENHGGDVLAVPNIRADLMSENGQLVASIVINAPVAEILAGQSHGFTTKLRHPGGKTPRVKLSFMETGVSGS